MKRSMKNEFLVPETDGPGGAESPRSQYGALCWRKHRGRVEVLLITSRDTGRWVIPKGWPMAGKGAAEAAAQEAWEEAGVTGAVAAESLGFFTYDKTRKSREALPCVVSVYALRVERMAKKFPERKERRRRWFEAGKAARLVAEPELQALLESLDGGTLDGGAPAGGGVVASA